MRRLRKPVEVIDIVQHEPVKPRKVLLKSKKNNVSEYIKLAQKLDMIKEQKKELEKQEADVRSMMDVFVDKNVKADAKGTRLFSFSDMYGVEKYYVREARNKVSLKEEAAKKLFKKKGLLNKVYKSKTEYYFDEEEIQQLVANKSISRKEFIGITENKLTYATKIVVKKEGEETEGEE